MRYLNFFISVLLSLLYATGKIPPSEKFNLWITSFIIPVALVGNLVLLIVSLIMRKKSALYYIVALIIGGPYLISSVGVKHIFHQAPPPGISFTAINYNIGGYNMRPYIYRNYDSARVALKNWILNADADIKCLQEFSNFPRSKEFNLLAQLESAGTNYFFSSEKETDHSAYSRTGTLIISRFPIFSSGDLLASENGFNRISFADIVIHKDTIRVINVHLESMGLTNLRRRHNRSSVQATATTILTKLKTGVFERTKQIKQLVTFIDASPYPVICAGDFNDLPYSYAYQFIKKKLKNAFEESGTGMGFTYHGRTLSGLRIDNQFYTPAIRCAGFETMDSIKFSDHFPLWGRYILSDPNTNEK